MKVASNTLVFNLTQCPPFRRVYVYESEVSYQSIYGVIIMKNILQGIALFAVIFAFGAVANAQINFGADVEIPFEFSVGEKVYEAGRYSVKINRQMVAGAAFTIQRTGSDEAQTVLLSNNGGARSGDVQLVFSSVDGRKYLTGVTTSNSDYAVLTKAGRSGKLAKVRVNAATRTTGL